MPNERKDIDINDLLLDLQNPRIGKTLTQEETVRKIIAEQDTKNHNKIFNLAKHVIENGLSPVHSLSVIIDKKEKGKYKIIDGNRRATAIKLVIRPDLTLGSHLEKQFFKLHNEHAQTIQRKISCVIMPMEEAKKWRKVEHDKGQAGIQLESWEALAKERQNQSDGNPSLAILALDISLETNYLDSETREIASGNSFNITTFGRILTRGSNKETLGIRLKDNDIFFEKDKDWTLQVISKIISVVAKGHHNGINFSSRDVENPEKAQDFVEKIISEIGEDGKSETSEPNLPIDDNFELDLNIPPKPEWDRKNLILGEHHLPKSQSPKLRKLYYELKNDLTTNKRELAVALSFRALLENSVINYCNENGIQFKNERTPVIEKLKAALKDMKDKKRITEDDAKIFEARINDNPLALTREFNIYVHSPDHIPTKQILHERWDLTKKLFIKLWEYS